MLAQLLWVQGRVPEAIERLKKAMQLLADGGDAGRRRRRCSPTANPRRPAGHQPADDLLDQALAVAERLGRKDLVLDARMTLRSCTGSAKATPVPSASTRRQ